MGFGHTLNQVIGVLHLLWPGVEQGAQLILNQSASPAHGHVVSQSTGDELLTANLRNLCSFLSLLKTEPPHGGGGRCLLWLWSGSPY